jgi:putative oxidoreductase
MTPRREGLRDAALFAVRFACGFMLFYMHGLDKLKGAYAHFAHGAEWGFPGHVAEMGLPMPTVFAVCAVIAEGIASLFLAAGLFTKYAAILVTLLMTGAVFSHIKAGQGGEMAVLYLVMAFLFIFHDPGRFALDSLRRRRR